MDYDLASVDYILQTTRSVRKRLDLTRPVERDVVMDCMEIALQAPSASNTQRWRWVIVIDPDKKAQIGAYYQKSYANYTAPDAKLVQPGLSQCAKLRRERASLISPLEGFSKGTIEIRNEVKKALS